MKRKIATLALGLVFGGQMAFAVTTESVIADLQAEGYSRVEVKVGPTQMKVEAIRGTEKLEMVVQNETGQVLKSEAGQVRLGENTTPGVSVRERNGDFVRVAQRTRARDDDSDDDLSDDGNRDRDRDRNRDRDRDRVRDGDDDGSSGKGRGRGGDDRDDDRDDDRGGDSDGDSEGDRGGDDSGGDRDGDSSDD